MVEGAQRTARQGHEHLSSTFFLVLLNANKTLTEEYTPVVGKGRPILDNKIIQVLEV